MVATLLLVVVAMASCTIGGRIYPWHEYDVYFVEPADDSDELDVEWAQYLYDHLDKRASEPSIVANWHGSKPNVDMLVTVRADFDPELTHDYEIEWGTDQITLKARRKATMLWLIYQFMATLGEADPRIDTNDIPPAFIDMKPTKGDYAFEYRGIYSASNQDTDRLPITASQNVDSDWGIWGHNLAKVFPDGVIPYEAMAEVDGERTPEQICFSSEALYKAAEAFIVNHYGDTEDDFARFVIMPNDNELVCTCGKCRLLNHEGSASESVADLIRRLAQRFPQHQFFTSAYLSTVDPPSAPLPSNAGVIISAIDHKMNGRPQDDIEFASLLSRWHNITDRIFIWDYVRNFDDYLTPYPVSPILKERINNFKAIGVTGVFLNGSGYNYSTFEDMQTWIASALLVDPKLDVDSLTNKYLVHFYPQTHTIIAPYMRSIQQRALYSEKGLPFYGGIRDAKECYLDSAEFVGFYHDLVQKTKTVTGSERKLLNKLVTGLCFPYLELLRTGKDMYNSDLTTEPLATLSDHVAFDDMTEYREANGDLTNYLKQWALLPDLAPLAMSNALKGHKLKAVSQLDDDYQKTSILTDGLVGFPTDWHTNWLINSRPSLSLELPPGRSGTLTISFMHAPRWRISAPARVEILSGGRVVASAVPTEVEPFNRSIAKLPYVGGGVLRIVAAGEKQKIAVDEVMLN